MLRRPLFWLTVSLLCLVGAFYFWRQGEARRLAESSGQKQSAPALEEVRPAATTNAKPAVSTAPTAKSVAAATAAAKSRYPYRLSNTSKTTGQLLRSGTAIHLMNALIDTAKPVNLTIPDRLRAPKDNGSFIVQARGEIDNNFRAMLQNAGATIVSPIPNNAFLVRVSDAGAQQIAASAQSVLAYEPYYKLDPSLLKAVMEEGSLPTGTLKVTLFPDASASILSSLSINPMSTERSPFGQVVTVPASLDAVVNIAQLPGVQAVAPAYQRKTANDLSRVTLGVSADTLTGTSNYLGLNGTGVMININDTGIDASHPDLTGRIFGNATNSLVDTNGHGTHVAGTILGDGTKSSTVINAIGSVTNASFRGMASGATAFSIDFDSVPDSELQEAAAETNALISNNSWNYADPAYDIAAASFDAAVRDALPEATGPQPMIFVFSAGNDGGGNDDGQSGASDSILSPGTAKNAITVGAVEQFRNITNQVVESDGTTNTPFLPGTDTGDQVASFSARGNVGIGAEGDNGRFKPDVVAPGTFVISTRSQQWDTNAYYDPTNIENFPFPDQSVDPGNLATFLAPVPSNPALMIITVSSNLSSPSPFPLMPIYVALNAPATSNDFVGFNQVVLPTNSLPLNFGDTVFIAVGDGTNITANFDLNIEILETNADLAVLGLLRTLNDTICTPPKQYYRYETGTSMAAAGVSGVLACMEQFFGQNLKISNASPALMKALLINGSRSLSSPGQPYDFNVSNPLNIQGWGLPSLPNCIPLGFTNNLGVGNASPILFFDQDPANALATGQSKVRNLALFPDATQQPLRVTLVWTDPPGNPVAGIKLVNDLDLIVSNIDTHEVYYGNDIPAGSIFNEVAPTNGPVPADAINNVENVYLPEFSGTNFAVIVYARHVNVNATTLNNTGVVQDYALVVKSGDAGSTITNIFSSVTDTPVVSLNNVSPVTTLNNGVPLLNQRIGANSQYASTTNGITNNWNFYSYTNTASLSNSTFTNVAFITFFPPNLGVPRMEASGELDPSSTNATRFAGADVDLYVSTDPGLTNLDPLVISNAVAAGTVSIGRTGDETVVFTNSGPGQVYYIGIKSEDQQGAQYGFAGIASSIPFNQTDTNGNQTITMMPLPAVIPTGSAGSPQFVLIFGVSTLDQPIRKVSVTNTVTHQNFGDLIGTLTHSGTSVTLNNHDPFTNGNDTTETFIYDDSGENDIPGSRPSASPGSLRSYVGAKAVGSWIFSMVNDSSPTDTGQIDNFQMTLEKQTTNSTQHNLLGNEWFYDFVDVPVNCTNLTVLIGINSGSSLDVVIKRGGFPTLSDFDKMAVINPPGGQMSISTFDSPPLNPGRYYIGVFNPNAAAVNFNIAMILGISTTPAAPFQFLSIGNEPIADDAVTYSTNHVGLSSPLVSAEVGVRIDHPRVSDLVLTLISPQGTRVLLAENRGGLTTNYGSGFNTTNSLGPQNANGNSAPQTNTVALTNGQATGTLVISYDFFTVPDDMRVYYGGARIFDSGLINGSGTFAVDFGPGTATNIDIVMNDPGTNPSTNTSDAWNYSAIVITKGTTYAVFTEDTNKTTMPIKFAVPPFGAGPSFTQPINIFTSSFEVTPGDYTNGSGLVDGWSSLSTNPVTVVSVPALADLGSNVLALHKGSISRSVPTVPGTTYTLTFAAHGQPQPIPAAVGWWKGDNSSPVDSASTNNGFFPDNTYTNGLVNLAFQLDGGLGHVRVPDSASLEFSNSMTAEAWIYPTNLPIGAASVIIAKADWPLAPVGQSAFTMQIDPNGFGAFYVFSDGNNATGPAYTLAQIPQNQWTHLACTYDGANLNVFMNGVQGTPVAFTGTVFSGNDDLGIGDSIGGTTTDPILAPGSPFAGVIDEATVYSNALTLRQVQDIYAAGSAGKVTTSPGINAIVSIGGVSTNFFALDGWTDYSFTFTATDTNTAIRFRPITDGMLLDSVLLVESSIANPSNYFLPEESLSKLVGENPTGEWRLEVLDNRAGPAVTNPIPLLISWQLNLITETLLPTATPLSHGIPVSNTVPPNTTAYFVVGVPPWALFATNTLFNVVGGPLNLLFNQNFEPGTTTNGGDFSLIPGGVASSNFVTLSVSNVPPGLPPLIPGEQYYLGVQNPNQVPVSFSIEVDFDITTLTNLVPLTNSLPVGGIPRYYQFDVDTNAFGVTFQLLNVTGSLSLVASKGPPLPTLSANAYSATYVGSPTETILVLSNSTPVSLSPGRWYLGVFNLDPNPAGQQYTILASELTAPSIIWLTNGIPYTMTNYPPGPAASTFFGFIITNSPVSALFELYGMNGSADLTLSRGTNNLPYGPPAPPSSPYFATSSNPGTNDEQIVVRTNGTLNGVITTNLNDTWYLGVPNTTSSNITFTIYAVVSTNGLLTNGFPTTIGIQNGTNGLTFTWPTIAGQTYEIQSTTNLFPPSVWSQVVILSNAPPGLDSFLDTNAIAGTPMMFYRLLQLPTP